MKLILYPYSWVSRGANRVRDRLYRAGVFGSKKCGLKVISVGNISLGGTGKTPLVLELLKALQSEGLRAAMVSRGYKGRWEKKGGMLTDGEKFYGGWKDSGDEPFMVARNAPGAGIFVGASRLRSCRLAKVKGFAAVVLDDGFQHRKLHRDLDIVLYTPKEKILREPLASLSRAQIILVPEEEAEGLRQSLAGRFPQAHVYAYAVVPRVLIRVGSRSGSTPLADFRGAPVVAFCGIARPQRFFDALERLGLDVRARIALPDHHPYPEATLEKIGAKCAALGPRALLTTEKDAVKLAGRTAFLKSHPVYYLKIGLKVEQGFFDQVRKSLTGRERPHR